MRSVPFWQEVYHTERRAGASVAAFTPMIQDPRVREAALAGVLAEPPEARGEGSTPAGRSRASAAVGLRAHLERDSTGLSAGEAGLLRELLDRLTAS